MYSVNRQTDTDTETQVYDGYFIANRRHGCGVAPKPIPSPREAAHEGPRHSPVPDLGCVGRVCEQPGSPRLLPRMRTGPRNHPLINNAGLRRGRTWNTVNYIQLNRQIIDCGSTGEL